MSFLAIFGKFRLARSGGGTADSCNLNSCDSATGMAAANGLAIDAVVFAAHRAVSPDGLGVRLSASPARQRGCPNPQTTNT